MGSNPLFAMYQPGSMELTMRGTTLQYFYNGEKHFSVEIPVSKDFSIKIERTIADAANAEFREQNSKSLRKDLIDASELAREAEKERVSKIMETLIQPLEMAPILLGEMRLEFEEQADDSVHRPKNITRVNHGAYSDMTSLLVEPSTRECGLRVYQRRGRCNDPMLLPDIASAPLPMPAGQAVTELLQHELAAPPQPIPAAIYPQAVNNLIIQQKHYIEVDYAAVTQKNHASRSQDGQHCKSTSLERHRGKSRESVRKRAIDSSDMPRRRSTRKCVRLRKINYSDTRVWGQRIMPGWSSSDPIALDEGLEPYVLSSCPKP